jgi:outer membrane protein OmpA-like peptidoglycan-associated protein
MAVVVVTMGLACASAKPDVVAQAGPPVRAESGADEDDLCPNADEDLDGFEDDDGCPDPDNDQDRIVDADDACPDDPEIYNGVDDDDGCPEGCRLPIVEAPPTDRRVQFGRDSVDVPRRHAVVDALVDVLREDSTISELAVIGYASDDEEKGNRLARRRAETVRAALVARGVTASRLRIFHAVVAPHVDSTYPVSEELSRATARRVEFRVLSRNAHPVARWDGTRMVDLDE